MYFLLRYNQSLFRVDIRDGFCTGFDNFQAGIFALKGVDEHTDSACMFQRVVGEMAALEFAGVILIGLKVSPTEGLGIQTALQKKSLISTAKSPNDTHLEDVVRWNAYRLKACCGSRQPKTGSFFPWNKQENGKQGSSTWITLQSSKKGKPSSCSLGSKPKNAFLISTWAVPPSLQCGHWQVVAVPHRSIFLHTMAECQQKNIVGN